MSSIGSKIASVPQDETHNLGALQKQNGLFFIAYVENNK